jgi:hypothetical protein
MGFKPAQPASRSETVNEFTDRMHSTLTEAKAALAKAQEDMTHYYNQRQEPALEYCIILTLGSSQVTAEKNGHFKNSLQIQR